MIWKRPTRRTSNAPLSCTLKLNFSFVNSFSLKRSEATERSAFVFTLHIFHAFKQSRWKITRSRLKASWFFWSLTYGNKRERKKFPRWCSFAVYCCFLSVWNEIRSKTERKKLLWNTRSAAQSIRPWNAVLLWLLGLLWSIAWRLLSLLKFSWRYEAVKTYKRCHKKFNAFENKQKGTQLAESLLLSLSTIVIKKMSHCVNFLTDGNVNLMWHSSHNKIFFSTV